MTKTFFLLLFLLNVSVAVKAETLPSEILGSNEEEIVEDKSIFNYFENAQWKKSDIQTPYLKLNALRFTNKARCALDSQRPTSSFYVLVDSLNLAKGAYRLALATGQDQNLMSRQAVERFRYSVLKLIDYISKKMLRGELPILPSDLTANDSVPEDSSSTENYRRIVKSCRLDEYCSDLDTYLSSLWNYPKGKDKAQIHWEEVDNFEARNFISVKGKIPNYSCYYLKKHSPLESHLDAVVPDKVSLMKIADAMIDQKNLLSSCDDMDAQKSIEFSSYQLDLQGLENLEWDKVGFDFYHSLKLYFSWAWRNAPEIASFTYPFQNYFKSVHLEDSVVFFSNGCQSLVKPACDTQFLNEQTLRYFAQKDYSRNDSAVDNLLYLPQGATSDLVKNPDVPVNNDGLDLNKFSSMDEWMKNFRENIRKSRGLVKGRLVRALTLMNLILKNLSKNQIMNDLREIKKGAHQIPYKLGNRTPEELKLKQFYALCSESFVASDEILSFLRKDLTLLKDLKTLDPLFERFTDYDLNQFYNYYENLFVEVRTFCKELEAPSLWPNDFEMEKGLFSPWYKEAIHKGQVTASDTATLEVTGKPLLAYRFFSTTNSSDQVICWDGIDCSRKVLESLINLYSVAQYKELYFPKSQNIQTLDLANPYAERVACQVYDPWWQTKKAFFDLTSNVAAAGISMVNPTPFYLSVGLAPKSVISFNKMLEKGMMKLDPKFDSSRVMATFGADFGKWLGVPCSVFVSNQTPGNLPTRVYFTGLTVEACRNNTSSGAVVSNGSDIEVNPKKKISACVSCSLNFAKMLFDPNATLPIPLPAVQSVFYLLRGSLLFFKDLRAPVNIPHQYTVNPNYVLETYRRYGEIPKKCVRDLKKARPCLENLCEQALADFFEEGYGGSIETINLKGDKAKVKLAQCQKEIEVKDIRRFVNLSCRGKIDASQVNLKDICKIKKETIPSEIH